MSIFRLFAAAATVAVLCGCAALPPAGGPTPRAAAFDLLGRVAVTFDGKAFSSGVRWHHQAEHDEIWLLTPTGQALAHITADASGATLTGADQNQYQAADVERLTRRALGWELPLARLTWWVRGEVAPGMPADEALRDQQGRLLRLQQDGWQITYTRTAAAPGALPQRLDLARDGYQIRFVIDNWRESGAAP
jgi:outer membrane lipoprotein LolB